MSNTDNPTSRPSPRIPRLLTLLIATLAKIIRASMHDNSAPKHALRPDQLNQLIGRRALAIALSVRLEVAEVAYVAVGVFGGAVFLALRVDYS